MSEEKKPRKLINHPDFEIYVPEKVTVIGFIVITAIVVGLIFLTKWVVGIGGP